MTLVPLPWLSDEDIINSACTSKRAYRTIQHADEVLARMRAQHVRGARRIRRYRCPMCRAHHLGHPPSIEILERLARIIRRLPPVP